MQPPNRLKDTGDKGVSFTVALSKHCDDGDTGILFLTTNDNKSCKIFLSKGEIEAISMMKMDANLVPVELRRSGVKACSFSNNFNLPYSEKDVVVSSDDLLIQLGCVVRPRHLKVPKRE